MVFTMRSELLGINTCNKLESASHPLRRRRMSKAGGTIVNGAADNKQTLASHVDSVVRQVSLAAAFHDHMSCAKSADLCKFQDFSEVSLPCETDHIYANCSDSPKNLLRDEARLKDMLLLHLDLIQHQQEQIQKKDLQIQKLKRENDSLKIRLERMDRRVSLLKQKELLLNSESNSSQEISLGISKSPTENRTHSFTGKTVKRSNSQLSLSKESGSDFQKSEKPKRDLRKFRRKSQEEQEIEWTDNCYYSSVGETTPSVNSRLSFPIEVPTWRYHPVSSCYQLEGTENIDDDIFLRRHLKLEQDERRRKRWDIQRLREQRHNEKLRRGRSLQKDAQKNRSEISSFFSSPKDVQYIEVTDSVPIIAFGHPIPKLQPCEFSLEWYDTSARNNSEDIRTKSKKCRSNGNKRGT